MTLEILNQEKIKAMKNGDKLRKDVIVELISAVKKSAIDKNCRDNIPESIVDEAILKCKKTTQESIDTCPVERVEILNKYKHQFEIICEFAPKLMENEEDIKLAILDIVNGAIEFTKANRGKVMKVVSPVLKSKANMTIVNKVVGDLLK